MPVGLLDASVTLIGSAGPWPGSSGNPPRRRRAYIAVAHHWPCNSTSGMPCSGMTEYKLVFDGLRVFKVEIAPDGDVTSVLGFPTEAAALMWIAEQTAEPPGFPLTC